MLSLFRKLCPQSCKIFQYLQWLTSRIFIQKVLPFDEQFKHQSLPSVPFSLLQNFFKFHPNCSFLIQFWKFCLYLHLLPQHLFQTRDMKYICILDVKGSSNRYVISSTFLSNLYGPLNFGANFCLNFVFKDDYLCLLPQISIPNDTDIFVVLFNLCLAKLYLQNLHHFLSLFYEFTHFRRSW